MATSTLAQIEPTNLSLICSRGRKGSSAWTVVKWLPASGLKDPEKGEENPATAGYGLQRLAVEQRETAGAASKQTVDTPSAYVTVAPVALSDAPPRLLHDGATDVVFHDTL